MKRRKHPNARFVAYVLAALIVGAFACVSLSRHIKNRPAFQYCFGENTLNYTVEYPDARFAVISDIHYYDSTLGTEGPAFEACLDSDRKLLKEGGSLIRLVVNEIIRSNVDFVLVSGDLTKDGELVNHLQVADLLSQLTEKGIRVYVVPGNHDVNNPGAFRYEGEQAIPVPSVSHAEFSEIYQAHGYGDALYKDANSLSYVAALDDSLWLLALDTCRSEENKPGGTEIVGGKLVEKQEKWIEEMLAKARQEKKAVIVLAHHGIHEHFEGQKRFHDAFVIDNHAYIGKLLASWNVRIAFTGHYHAQDITLKDFGEFGFLYDIETGSLITPPCTLRYCTIENNQLKVQSEFLLDQLHPGTNFSAEASGFVHESLLREARKTLKKYLVPQKDADYIAEHAARAFAAHYSGDEDVSLKPPFDVQQLGLWSRFVYSQMGYVLEGLWEDLQPADNETVLNLEHP
jgi:UDP-2,3-diacylglucosamine pyrophosphatase LpxH